MTMFTELYALATTATLSMVISADEKRGTLTISVMPKPKKDVGEPALTKDLTLQILRYRVARRRQPSRYLADAELVHSVPAPNLADRFHADHSRSLRKSRSLSGCSLLRDQTASNLLSIA